MKFRDYKLDASICGVLHMLGYQSPLPVQEAIISFMLEKKDILVKSGAGSGKTASFAIPIIRDLIWEEHPPQALVLSPTRELALQIKGELDNVGAYKRTKTAAVSGKQPLCFQAQDVKQRTHVVVGTPGRVLDHLEQETLRIEKVRYIIIGEADEMLNMGFIETVQKILFRPPKNASVCMFSAALPQEIQEFAHDFLKQAEVVEIRSQIFVSEQIHHYVYRLKEYEKPQVLLKLSCRESPESCIIFAKTQGHVCEICRMLYDRSISADQLYDGVLQEDRLENMKDSRLGKLHILTATDVAARGIDIQDVTHIINYDMPNKKETYIHRIGRSARLDRSGTAISFVSQYDDFRLQELGEYLGNVLEFHDSSELEAIIADAEILRKLGISRPQKEEKGKKLRKDMMKLYLGGGKIKKTRPGDTVGAICETEGVCGDNISVVQVQDHQSYVDILHGKGLQVLHALRQKTIKGEKLKVERAKGQSYSCYKLQKNVKSISGFKPYRVYLCYRTQEV